MKFFLIVLSFISSEFDNKKELNRDNYKYEKALKDHETNNKPIMVFIGAKWCPACKVMKSDTLEPMYSDKELNSVNLVILDADADKELVSKLTNDIDSIKYPCTIVFTKNKDWRKLSVLGRQTRDNLKEFIKKSIGK